MRTCPDLEVLRAYGNGGLVTEEAEAVRAHLEECRECRSMGQEMAREVLAREGSPGGRLRRWQASLSFTRTRLALAGAAAAVILAGGLVWSPMRSAADDLLGIFRVQSFAVVKVDPAMLGSLPEPQDLGTFMGNYPKVNQVDSVAEAAQQAGFQVRVPSQLPDGLGDSMEINVSSPAQLTYTFDEAKLRAYLDSLGARGIQLPPAEDLKATLKVPAGVVIAYAGSGGKLVLVQGQSPTLEVPPALDVAGLREAVLGVLPADLASQLRALPDWQSTAVLPAPKDADSHPVTVDGVDGVLISSDGELVLLWQRDGTLYGLHGNLSEQTMLEVADSLVGH